MKKGGIRQTKRLVLRADDRLEEGEGGCVGKMDSTRHDTAVYDGSGSEQGETAGRDLQTSSRDGCMGLCAVNTAMYNERKRQSKKLVHYRH